jgi:hypothetical protein
MDGTEGTDVELIGVYVAIHHGALTVAIVKDGTLTSFPNG